MATIYVYQNFITLLLSQRIFIVSINVTWPPPSPPTLYVSAVFKWSPSIGNNFRGLPSHGGSVQISVLKLYASNYPKYFTT